MGAITDRQKSSWGVLPVLLVVGLACMAGSGRAAKSGAPAAAGELALPGAPAATGELGLPGPDVDRWHRSTCAPGRLDSFEWLGCSSRGDGAPALMTRSERFDPPVDLRGRFLRVRIRVEDVVHLAGIELRATSDGFRESFFSFPIPLFADPEFNVLQDGAWVTLTFSFGTARSVGQPRREAIDGIGLYFMDDATAPVRVSLGAPNAVPVRGEGLLSFTFDDGTSSHVEIAAPAMARHGFRGTAYVMPDEIGLQGYMTTEQLASLRDRFGWDVAAHHGVPFTGLSPAALESTIEGVQRYLRGRGYAEGAGHLAYPLGRQDPRVVRPLVRKHFTTARVAAGGPETVPPADPHLLRAVNVLDSTTPEELGRIARRAREHGEWAILMFHHLKPETSLEIDYSIDDFERALVLIGQSGVEVLPMSEAWVRIQGGSQALPAKSAR